MYAQTVDFDTLVRLTGYQRPTDIERWCEQNGVRYFRGRTGIFTTTTALNAGLGIYENNHDHFYKSTPKPLEF